MSEVVNLETLKKLRFKRSRVKPKKSLPKYPRDLQVTMEYIDSGGEYRQIRVDFENSPFDLKSMKTEYRKFLIEVCLQVIVDVSGDDPSLVAELEEHLRKSFNLES